MDWIYTKENPLRVVTLCSGYESQCMAIRNLGIPFDLVAWAEFDPESKSPLEKQPAVIAHNAVFPEYADRNLGDMTKIDWESVPDFIDSVLALAGEWNLPIGFFNESLHAFGTPEDMEQILLDITPIRVRIRKLTPKECMRLQAVSDEDFQKMQDAGLSNSALYKLAGNSICVAPLEGIFTQLFRADSDCLF